VKKRMLHSGRSAVLALIGATAFCRADTAPVGPADKGPGHDYPTSARVEYVQQCMLQFGGEVANLYKCSCAIDRIAKNLSYDDFVEWGTFAHYASLAGENNGIFRDSDEARDKAKRYRALETEAYGACGLQIRK
jgi:hypothetical protein